MLRRTSLILGAALLVTSSLAEAQERQRGQRPGQGGPGGFGGGGITTLLGMNEVQKELAVSQDQKGLIEDMLKDLRGGERGGGNRQDFQNLSDEERRKRFEEIRKQAEERAKKAEEMAKMILEPKQMERLNELRIQSDGLAALERTEVADKLDLSADQRDKIKKIRDESRAQGRPGGGGFGNRGNQSQEEREKAAAAYRERREKADANVLAVLTASQKQTWEKMQGKKFDFPPPQGRRPGGNDR